MFRKQYKKDFDSITPDVDFIGNLSKELGNSPTTKTPKRLVAAVVALCLLISGGIIAGNLNKPSFTIVAFAEDYSKKVSIEENARVMLPFGKISRGEKHSYIDETGKKVNDYDVGFHHGLISVEGENISSVTYLCEMGEFRHYDSIMAKTMEDEGQVTACNFTVPVELIPPGKDMHNIFENLWNEGFFDDIKEHSLKNQSHDLSDYQVRFRQDNTQMKGGMWSVKLLYKFENGHPFIQRGKKVTTYFYDELGNKSFNVNWAPWYAIDEVSRDKLINYEDLPTDNITITVNFASGKTQTKQLKLSFDTDGNLNAQVIKK